MRGEEDFFSRRKLEGKEKEHEKEYNYSKLKGKLCAHYKLICVYCL